MEKKKIYIIHGWAYETRRWKPFLDLLEKKGVEPVMLKVPGLTAPLDEVWGLGDYVEWLRGELEKEKKPVILLGHSNGGLISLGFALKYPERVERLILVDSSGVYHRDLKIRVKRLVFGVLAKVGKVFTKSELMRNFFYTLVREHDYERADPLLRETMRNLISVDIVPRLGEVKVPTLIIWGEDDGVTPLRDGRVMCDRIEGSELRVLKGARHSPQFTHAGEVAGIVGRIYGNI